MSRATLAAAIVVATCTVAPAQELNAALKELAAAANREGTLTLSWSGSTFAGIQGAARLRPAMTKRSRTNLRVSCLPGADMARVINQLATEHSAGQKASVDIALGAAPQIVPVLKANFLEPVDWKAYLPRRITDEMIEMDGRLIRIVTGLS